MGTRSEIYVRNSQGCVGLWKHYDGYPEYMVPMFKSFLLYAYREWRAQSHWLTYPEDLAALLIAWYYGVVKREARRLRSPFPVNADIRPLMDVSGEKLIEDAEYAWVLNVPEYNSPDLVYEVLGYRLRGSDGLTREEIAQVRERGRVESPNAELVVNEVVALPRKAMPALRA